MSDLRAYNVMFGLFQAPYYAFSQTMMAELTPPGFENMVRDRIARKLTRVFSILIRSHAVLWPVRTIKPRFIYDRTERHSGYNRQYRQQLEGIPVPLLHLYRSQYCHLVR